MSDLNIPEKLPKGNHDYFLSDFFSNGKTEKNIICYYHDSTLEYPIKMHSHEFYEINIVIQGRGVHYINGGKVYANEGDVFIICPHMEHGYFEIENMIIFHILINDDFFNYFNEKLELLDGYVSLFQIEPEMRNQMTRNAFLHLHKEAFTVITKKIKELMNYKTDVVDKRSDVKDEQEDNSDVFINFIKESIVFQMIGLFCYYYSDRGIGYSEEKKTQNTNTVFEYETVVIRVIEYMRKNLSSKITIEAIAENFHVSIATLGRYFKMVVNKTPMQYLLMTRIDKAKELLISTKDTIVNISLDCGFFDSSHFEKCFMKNEGISPSLYRKNNGKK